MTAWRTNTRSTFNGNCVEVTAWRTPARSDGNGECVEVGEWRKATRCPHSDCVEAGAGPGVVAVRDSKHPDGAVLAFTPAAWQAFLGELGCLGRP